MPAPGHKLVNFIDGKWWGVPFFCATGGYWVRKSWFDAVSFDITKQYTFQEWLEACLKVSDPSKKHWGWGNTVNRSGDGQTMVYSVLFQAGARVTTADNKVAFMSDETVAAYDWLKDVYTNPKWANALPTGVNAWTDPSNNEAYLADTIGFSGNAGTMFATAMKDKPDIAKDSWLALHPSGSVGKKESLIVAGPGFFKLYSVHWSEESRCGQGDDANGALEGKPEAGLGQQPGALGAGLHLGLGRSGVEGYSQQRSAGFQGDHPVRQGVQALPAAAGPEVVDQRVRHARSSRPTSWPTS